MTPDQVIAFHKEAYAQTVENMKSTKKDYANYFAKEFVMHIDGQEYYFDDYVDFMMNLKKDTLSVQIDFKQMVADENSVATVHTTHVVKQNGKEFSLEVMSLFKIKDKHFVSGYELTRRGKY